MSTQINDMASLADTPVTGYGDDYEAPRDTSKPPVGLQQMIRINENDNDTKEGATTASVGKPNEQKMWWAQFKFAVIGGEFDGRFVFDGVNSYVGQYRPSSSAADFLRAAKSTARPTTLPAVREAVLKTFGPVGAVLDWEWRCRTCEETFLAGAKSPKKPKKYIGKINDIKKTASGEVDYEQTCPSCNGSVSAQAKIKRFIVHVAGAPTTGGGAAPLAVADLPSAEG